MRFALSALLVLGALFLGGRSYAIEVPEVDKARDCSRFLMPEMLEQRMLGFYADSRSPAWVVAEFDLLASGAVENLTVVDSQPKDFSLTELEEVFKGTLFRKNAAREKCLIVLAHLPVKIESEMRGDNDRF